MKASELRQKSANELKKEVIDLTREQFNLLMQKGIGEMPRGHLIKKVRRAIARTKTIITEKERQA